MGLDYGEFLARKSQLDNDAGFAPLFMPSCLFDFQAILVEWALRKGRAALFEDCGLGKTLQELVWAQNIVQKENKPVLIIAPLAVSSQTVREGEKFGIECRRSSDGRIAGDITVTNYERLEKFNPDDFIGVVCDESSCLKNFDGVRKALITEFMRTRPYRLLCTATAAPNDYIELGTSSEALGQLGYMDMLLRFFKNDQNSLHPTSGRGRFERGLHSQNKWRFKKHAEVPFWQWVSSWARALRKPSDLGFDDGKFILPPLIERQTVVENVRNLPGELFHKIAVGLREQREEARLTLTERCEKVAELVSGHDRSVIWCHLNDEGDLLEEIIPDAVQVKGSDSDDAKEERLLAFADGKIKRLVTKSKIAGFGMNWQNCAHMTIFPSHSWEGYYQGVRRCWRFGQTRPVTVDIVTTPGGLDVLANLQRKAEAADKMFDALIAHMYQSVNIQRGVEYRQSEEIPTWL